MDELAVLTKMVEQSSDDQLTALVKQMLERNPDSYQVLRKAVPRLRDTEKSVTLLKELLLHRPNDAELHADLAGMYWLMGEDRLVEKHCKTAISSNPNMAKPYGLLASIYESRGERPEAIEGMFLKAEELEPEKWYRHSNLAHFYRQQGRVHEAMDEIREALSCLDLSDDERRRLQAELQEIEEAQNT